MKTAQEWQAELNGETSIESIQRIQDDALVAACAIVIKNGGNRFIHCIGGLMNGSKEDPFVLPFKIPPPQP